jgi:hypothetical protein
MDDSELERIWKMLLWPNIVIFLGTGGNRERQHDSQFPGRDWKRGPPECESRNLQLHNKDL